MEITTWIFGYKEMIYVIRLKFYRNIALCGRRE